MKKEDYINIKCEVKGGFCNGSGRPGAASCVFRALSRRRPLELCTDGPL